MIVVFRAAADATVLLHFAFVLFVVLGGLLAFRWRWVPWLHLPAAVWGAGIEAAGGICPLTVVENWLRVRAGEQGYAEGFVERYLIPVLYPDGLTRNLQLSLAVLVVVINVGVYAVWLRRQ